jgi:hypothetical protein
MYKAAKAGIAAYLQLAKHLTNPNQLPIENFLGRIQQDKNLWIAD